MAPPPGRSGSSASRTNNAPDQPHVFRSGDQSPDHRKALLGFVIPQRFTCDPVRSADATHFHAASSAVQGSDITWQTDIAHQLSDDREVVSPQIVGLGACAHALSALFRPVSRGDEAVDPRPSVRAWTGIDHATGRVTTSAHAELRMASCCEG